MRAVLIVAIVGGCSSKSSGEQQAPAPSAVAATAVRAPADAGVAVAVDARSMTREQALAAARDAGILQVLGGSQSVTSAAAAGRTAGRTTMDRFGITIALPAGAEVADTRGDDRIVISNGDDSLVLERHAWNPDSDLATLAAHIAAYETTVVRKREWQGGYLLIAAEDDRHALFVAQRVGSKQILCTSSAAPGDPWLATAERSCQSIRAR